MSKWVCSVCGYVHTGDTPPQKCPVCGAPASKFKKQDGKNDLKNGLLDCLKNESREAAEYLDISKIADREGNSEISEAFKRYANAKAENAAEIAELLKRYFG